MRFGNAASNAAQGQPPPPQETVEQIVARMLAAQGQGQGNNGNQGRQGGNITPNQSMTCTHYCWTHGLGRDPNHTSQTCTRQAHGHCTNATLDNMMGGNASIRRARGERAVYRPPQRNQNQGGGNNTNNNNGNNN